MKYAAAILFTFGLFFIACKKDNEKSTSSDLAGVDIIGQWKWVLQYNDGIFSGNYNPGPDSLTPQNTGIQEILSFNPNGTWSVTRDGSKALSGTFKLLTLPTPGGYITSLDLIDRNGKDSLVNHSIRSDSLFISDILVVNTHFTRVYIKQ